MSLVTIPANPKARVTEIASKADALAWQLAVTTGIPFAEAKSMLSSQDNTPRQVRPMDERAGGTAEAGLDAEGIKAAIDALKEIVKG